MPLMVSSKAAVFLLLASSAAGLAFDSVVRSDAGPGVPVHQTEKLKNMLPPMMASSIIDQVVLDGNIVALK
jgi:hypothetical protein